MTARPLFRRLVLLGLALIAAVVLMGLQIPLAHSEGPKVAAQPDPVRAPPAPMRQTAADALGKSAGCESCHSHNAAANDHRTMHANPGVVLGCTDCHGGNAGVKRPPDTLRSDRSYIGAMEQAHVLPRYPFQWNYPSSSNPPGSYTRLNRESPQFIRFINPGDLRVARESRGACHLPCTQRDQRPAQAPKFPWPQLQSHQEQHDHNSELGGMRK